ncbi:uncharacterized protein KY384_005039 [Bacidia gigantensis]|uniref:uncharacterized protein n=1 Tax=Bacidia gigantensis TaxID=2732470 RepID=UPI001D04B653|nr:uncharacterized protein KY384_005039 [Bacidia gigantensis]KAG8530536.1 hypothetical protein KY384_005039 [Bacidia gigantensis]
MTAQFAGWTVRVSLCKPSGEIVRGKVKEVDEGSQLILSNEENSQPFEDPAILSYSRKDAPKQQSSGHESQAKFSISAAALPQMASSPAVNGTPPAANAKQFPDVDPAATLSEPFSQTTLETSSNRNRRWQSPHGHISSTKPRRDYNRKGIKAPEHRGREGEDTEATSPMDDSASCHRRPPPQKLTKRSRRGGKAREGRNLDNQSGWATGDATDIQEMGDFDFEGNLSKFDKRKLFEQMRQDDTTADEERLHTFNRLPRLGTAGGKNLHHSEMVLDSPKQKAVEHSSADENFNGKDRRGSDRSIRKPLARKQHSKPSVDAHMAASGSLPDIGEVTPLSRTSTIDRTISRRESTRTLQPKPSFRLAETKRPCPCLGPLQMLELEQLSISSFGLTEDILTENAAIAIASNALSILQLKHTPPESDDTLDTDKRKTTPVVVILAGNNLTGSRAIASARHLRNHQTRVVLVVLGLGIEDDLLAPVKRQLDIFRKCDGRPISYDRLQRTLSVLKAPVGLIVDAMLGMHLTYDDLQGQTQTEFAQLALWANYYETFCISIDVPSGVDATTGAVTLDEENAYAAIMSEHVLCLGAPKLGLLTEAFREAYSKAEMKVCVADIGIPAAAWKRFRKRAPLGVEFGGHWTVKVEVCED